MAKLALVGFLSGVDPLVALELAGLPEAFGADGAHEVPLACVDVLVSLLMKIGHCFTVGSVNQVIYFMISLRR